MELILVMALLAVILGLSAPSLSRSFHHRNLEQEATRLLALTEYARDEAVSQGVPTVVWVDQQTGRFGADAQPGYTGDGVHPRAYILPADLHFDPIQSGTVQHQNTSPIGADAAEFSPDGTLDPASTASIKITARDNSSVIVTQTSDTWGYEIAKP